LQVIITQLFYDVEVFLQFARDVRSMGITAPILPGIMILNAYGGFQRMTGFCKTRVPESVAKRVEELKEDAEGTKAYGIELGTSICRTLLASGLVQGTSPILKTAHPCFPTPRCSLPKLPSCFSGPHIWGYLTIPS
jgi:5,10-methylenetetrahydrofolate reductase